MMVLTYNLVIIFMFAQFVLSDWLVTYKTFQEGSSHFKKERVRCGGQFARSEFSGFGIANGTNECFGLARDWTLDPQVQNGNLYMVKTFAEKVFTPPIRAYRMNLIPGVLSTNSRVTIVFGIPAKLHRFSFKFVDRSVTPDVTFRMKVFTRVYNTPQVKFVHTANNVDTVELTNLFPYSVNTPLTVKFVFLDNVIRIFVDGSPFYNWNHRHPPSRFGQFRVWLENADDRLDFYSISHYFPHL